VDFRGLFIKEEVVPMGTAAQAQVGQDRARERRLKAARERRLRLDPSQLVREKRIDEAAVDVEVAWEERLAVKDVLRLTGLDQATVGRPRQLDSDTNDVGTEMAR
jgi:hypothetical protein